MCDRVDRFMDVGEELIDHLLWYATYRDCSYALVELRRIQQRAELAIKHIEEQQEKAA
jgi:hypothetical protein